MSSSSRVRQAATVLLVRAGSAAHPEVYLLRRPANLHAFAGLWAFPGGSVDEQDRDPRWAALLELTAHEATQIAQQRETTGVGIETRRFRTAMGAIIAAHLGAPVPDDPIPDPQDDPPTNLAVWVTALRELFEETGVLLATPATADTAFPEPAALLEARKKLRIGERQLIDILHQFNLRPQRQALAYLGRLLTPSTEPRRYDTRFFLAFLPQTAAAEGRLGASEEVDEERWITSQEAVKLAEEGQLPMAPPTRYALQAIAPYPSLDALWSRFAL
ncbi:MAG: hypothetical protein IMW91_08905 [Firmicutes bacterium]|nr:hypothetical protein [Bacillota bacterium]